MTYGVNSKKKEFKGKCIVAFVDILGFSQEIKDNWTAVESNPIDRLKLFSSQVNSNISKQIKGLRSKANRDTFYGCKIRTFSDSVIVTYAFNGEPNSHELLIGLFYIVYTLSQIWKIALRCNFTVRGGVEIGEMYWNDKMFAGPSFIEAYKLESKIALSSRIIIGNNLKWEICNAFNTQSRHKQIGKIYNSILKDKVRPFLCVDCDNYIILSPHSLYKKPSDKDKLIIQLTEMQEKCTTLDTILKYVPLINSLNGERKELTDAVLCNLRNNYAKPTT